MDEFNTLLSIAASVLAIGAGLTAYLRKKKHTPSEATQKAEYINTHGAQLNVSDHGQINIGGNLVNQNITHSPPTVPPALAKPKFRLTQRSFSGTYGYKREFTFELSNLGGTCYNLEILRQGKSLVEFPSLARGQSKSFRIDLINDSRPLDLLVRGHDSNGEKYQKLFIGTLYGSGFTFD